MTSRFCEHYNYGYLTTVFLCLNENLASNAPNKIRTFGKYSIFELLFDDFNCVFTQIYTLSVLLEY